MLASIRNRLILIVIMVVVAIAYLVPRNQTVREPGRDGVPRDTVLRRVPLKLGLDLQGGYHLGLELDTSVKASTDPKRDIGLALTVLRKRIDQFGVTEPVIQQVGDRIVVELAGLTDPVRAKSIVTKNSYLEFKFTDKTGALEPALPSMDRALIQAGEKPISTSAAGTPANGAVAALLGADTAKIAAARRDSIAKAHGDTSKVKRYTAKAGTDTSKSSPLVTPSTGKILQGLIVPAASVGIAGMPGEYAVPAAAYDRVGALLLRPEVKRLWPRGIDLKWGNLPVAVGTVQYRLLYALEDKAIVTGERLIDATPQLDQVTNSPIVQFELDTRGGRAFGAQTGRHLGDYMAIVLADQVQGRPPVIQSRIDRRGQIELRGRSIQEAQDLSLTLKAGALPMPLKVVEERQIGASLGEDSIHDGIRAGLVGTAIVIIIMIGYYRLAGVLAVAALALYILFTLAGLSALEATLTLPGIAGIVLSIGIAVDANVLIFERIREELIAGRTVRVAVDEGFRHAMAAIVDSSISTIITALFLFQFGTGPVKGFAVTLIMGIAASLVTAVFVTRTFFMVWLERRPAATTLSI